MRKNTVSSFENMCMLGEKNDWIKQICYSAKNS